MKINGIDARKYDAKQLTVEIQPPSTVVSYEWVTGANQPTEFDTDIQLGHIKMCVYFKGKDRNSITREMSEFMSNFSKSCDLELDGYKGKYKGFMTNSDYEKTITEKRTKLNIEFDGYFHDDEIAVEFNATTAGSFIVAGSRKTPCIVEVYARASLTNYKITGFGEDDIVIESLAAGKTVLIDGTKGLVSIDGANAFDKVNIWEFPALKAGEAVLQFSNSNAKVKVRYEPMWI